MPTQAAGREVVGLLRLLSVGALGSLGLLVVIQALERGALIAVAAGFAHGGDASALAASAALGGLFIVRGAVRGSARRDCKTTFAELVVDRLLATDALEAVPTDGDEPVAATFDSLFAGQQLVVDYLPSLGADGIAACAIGVAIAIGKLHRFQMLLPLGIAVLAVASTMVGAAYVFTGRLARASNRAFGSVYDDIVTALGGRMDLVSSGRDDEFRSAVRAHLRHWRSVAARADAMSAFAGRAPVVAASVAIGLAFWLSASLRGTLGSLGFADAAVAASFAPPFFGIIRNILQVARETVRVRPLIALMTGADGPRGAPAGTPLPSLPTSVRWDGVSFIYGHATRITARRALDDVAIEWLPRTILALGGPNGSGKSTLLRIALGLAQPTSGQILLGGQTLFSLDLGAWRRSVSYLPQRPYLGEDGTTVRDAVLLIARAATDDVIREALKRVSLWQALCQTTPSDPMAVRVRTLSAGQKQKLALARVLCQTCPVVILDEPDANLDRAGVEMVVTLVRELRVHSMVAIAAHTPELLATGDVQIMLSDGRVAHLARGRDGAAAGL